MPTRPPPPEPYETWLDFILVNPHRNGYGPCVKYAAAELAELRAEDESSHALIVKQAKLLTGVANALRGDPEPLHLHSHHDLPELAAELREEVERLRNLPITCVRCLEKMRPDPADKYLRTARKA